MIIKLLCNNCLCPQDENEYQPNEECPNCGEGEMVQYVLVPIDEYIEDQK